MLRLAKKLGLLISLSLCLILEPFRVNVPILPALSKNLRSVVSKSFNLTRLLFIITSVGIGKSPLAPLVFNGKAILNHLSAASLVLLINLGVFNEADDVK